MAVCYFVGAMKTSTDRNLLNRPTEYLSAGDSLRGFDHGGAEVVEIGFGHENRRATGPRNATRPAHAGITTNSSPEIRKMKAVEEKNPTVPPFGRRAFKLKEAADIIGVSTKSLRRAIARGLIKPNRVFRHLLIPAAELDRFVKQ